MSKRFIDLSSLPKAFRKLELSLKWAYVWVWNNCDASGYWEIDEDYFEFENAGISWSSLDWSVLDCHVLLHDDGILLTDFIPVNYGTLKQDYNPHKPAFRAIEKNNLVLNLSLNQACFKLIEEDEDEEEYENKGGAGGSLHPVNPDLMGFKGKCRFWLEEEKNYIWGKQDDFAIDDLERKIKEVHRRAGMPTDKEALYGTFMHLIEKLPEWVRENKFSLDYINQKFNEVTNAINSNKQSGKKGAAPISDQDEARLRALLESGALLGVD